MGSFIVVPIFHEISQAIFLGYGYLNVDENLFDVLYIFTSIATGLLHYYDGPYMWYSKGTLVLVILLATRRTFQFLRIFDALSTIVVMVQKVFLDLGAFMTFYVMIIIFLSIILNVLCASNINVESQFRDDYGQYKGKGVWGFTDDAIYN